MSGVFQMAMNEGFVYQRTGSNYTCYPPVEDTDIDYIIHSHLCPEYFMNKGYTHTSYSEDYDFEGDFETYRKGRVNLIVTPSLSFYNKFVAATERAKELNLLDKADRIELFQGYLYGGEEISL